MSYLIDTNVVSELARPRPAPQVSHWFDTVADDALYLSVLSLGELRRGVELLPAGKRREQLRHWLERELPAWFGARLLPLDAAVADTWGRLQAKTRRTLPAIDSLLAATALHHHLRLVTRNTKDFDHTGLDTLNPWSGDG
ncbi:MAG: type II toxin-antitoxin system VapC family toxin [Steroidobacteraceae bacterium]|nr:type II toxin-antitoxin system VapC family toxin [Steroidobacteraceae bacterium]